MIRRLLLFPLFVCVCGGRGEVWSWVLCAVLSVLSSYVEERADCVTFKKFQFIVCLMGVGLQYVIVVLTYWAHSLTF